MKATRSCGGCASATYSGALRSAATVLAEDPIFGLFAYGGEVARRRGAVEVVPKDGLRVRFHAIRGGRRLHLELERDGFAAGPPGDAR